MPPASDDRVARVRTAVAPLAALAEDRRVPHPPLLLAGPAGTGAEILVTWGEPADAPARRSIERLTLAVTARTAGAPEAAPLGGLTVAFDWSAAAADDEAAVTVAGLEAGPDWFARWLDDRLPAVAADLLARNDAVRDEVDRVSGLVAERAWDRSPARRALSTGTYVVLLALIGAFAVMFARINIH